MFATSAFALTAAFAGSVVDAACGPCASPAGAYDVVIIGAGMAGVSAARRLEEAGFDSSRYIVVEANDYIGGRMRKDTFGDSNTIIEWGANWCEGGAQNPILDLAFKYDVDYDAQAFTDWDTYLKKANGNVDPIKHNKVRKQINSARQAFGNCLSGVAENYDVNDPGAFDPGYKDALNECGWDPTGDALQEGVDWYSSSYAFPDSTDRLGVYNYFYQAPYNSQYFLVVDQDDGIAGVATNQVDNLNLNVQLNTYVDCVDWDSSTVNVHTSQGCYHANIVISTLSVGALTQDPGIFYPSLVTVKNMNMNPYNFGVYNKVMCQFPEKFWGDEEFIHIVSEVDPRGYCSFWQNLDLSYFIPGSRILFCTLTTEIIDQIGTGDGEIPASVIDDFVQPLFEAFDVDSSKRNNYECDYYNWKDDPYTFGSYAYWKIGGDIPGFNHFFEPLTNGGSNKVIFGGAASCLDFGERLQGALFSGQDAANAALKELGEITNYDSVCVL